MLVDLVRIHVRAGRGGAGCISFRREKYVPKGGPDGGDGGRGGSVWLEVDPHMRTLLDFRERPEWKAEPGRPGSGNQRSGRDGVDLVIRVPPGTQLRDADTREPLADLLRAGDRYLAARGGRGGRGNTRFATSTHQAPRRADPGEEGGDRALELELKLIADVGLVGLPNAGKSTMLSRITRARPRIGDYPFTTLEPNLGIVALDPERTFVVADLPGLIEGAHEGRGLGLQFLRHVERTRLLAFLIDGTSEHPAADLELLRRELAAYSEALAQKPAALILTKADAVPAGAHGEFAAGAGMPEARRVSAHSGEGLRDMLEDWWRRLGEAAVDPEPEHPGAAGDPPGDARPRRRTQTGNGTHDAG